MVAMEPDFSLLTRIWCIAELVEARKLHLQQALAGLESPGSCGPQFARIPNQAVFLLMGSICHDRSSCSKLLVNFNSATRTVNTHKHAFLSYLQAPKNGRDVTSDACTLHHTIWAGRISTFSLRSAAETFLERLDCHPLISVVVAIVDHL